MKFCMLVANGYAFVHIFKLQVSVAAVTISDICSDICWAVFKIIKISLYYPSFTTCLLRWNLHYHESSSVFEALFVWRFGCAKKSAANAPAKLLASSRDQENVVDVVSLPAFLVFSSSQHRVK